MSNTITLRAVDLLFKNAFGDGDILELMWDELEAEGFCPHQDGLLESLVERHLGPLLPPGSKLYRISSIHNPIRIEYEDDDLDVMHALLSPISVDVTVAQVIALARELKAAP